MNKIADAIRPIFFHHNLPSPENITPLAGGMVNAVFAVDDAYIIRFNQRDKETAKFAREAAAYRVLDGRVPVPKLIAYSNERQFVDCEYIVMSRLAGQSLRDGWAQLSDALREAVAFEAGAILARIHQVEIGVGFGRMETREHQTWRSYVEAYAARNLAKSRQLDILSGADAARIERLIADASWLDEIVEPVLVHADFWFGNVHCDAGKITGIYDFEWATAGDRALDLKDMMYLDEYAAMSRQPFEAGYQSILPMPHDFERKSHFYQTLYELELLPVSFEHWGQARFEETREYLQQLLIQF